MFPQSQRPHALECPHLTSPITLSWLENSAHHPPFRPHNISGRHLKDELCLLGQLAHPTGEESLPGGATNPGLISSLLIFFFLFIFFTREAKFLIYWQHHGKDASWLPVTLFMFTQFIFIFFYHVCTFKHDWVWVWDSDWSTNQKWVTSACQGSICIPGRDSKEDWSSSIDRFGCSITATIMKMKHKWFYIHRSAFIYLSCCAWYHFSIHPFVLLSHHFLSFFHIHSVIFSIFNVPRFSQCW